MTTQLFVNLPTTDLPRAREFFTALGWEINPNFSDDNAICVVMDDNAYIMVLTKEFFQTFSDKPIGDPHEWLQTETAFSCESREAVDRIMHAALGAGAVEEREAQDLGFMYGRAFYDPDGNRFSPFWMDPAAAEGGPEAASGA